MNIVTVGLATVIVAGLIWAVICAIDIWKQDAKKKKWEKEAKKYRPSRPT